jgi:hypothetical protein
VLNLSVLLMMEMLRSRKVVWVDSSSTFQVCLLKPFKASLNSFHVMLEVGSQMQKISSRYRL